jgi:hypothetical protein
MNCDIQLNQKTLNKVGKINTQSILLPYYNLYVIGRAYDSFTPEASQQICVDAFKFLNSEGAAIKTLKKLSDTTYGGSGLVLEILADCVLSTE